MPKLIRGPEPHEYRLNSRRGIGSGGNGLVLFLWVAFGVLLWVSPETLHDAWTWISDLPIVFEVLAWVLLLPWMLAYLVVESSLAGWLQWLIVLLLAFVTIAASSIRRRA